MSFTVTVTPQQQFNPGDQIDLDGLNLLAQPTITVTGASTGLSDWAAAAPTANQIPVWNASTSKWTPGAVPGMTGATISANGAAGAVPQPLTANVGQFLRGDGTWATPQGQSGSDQYLNQNSY